MAIDDEIKEKANRDSIAKALESNLSKDKGATKRRGLDGLRAKQVIEAATATNLAANAAVTAVAEEAESATAQADAMHQGLRAIKAAGLAEEMANEGRAASQNQATRQTAKVQPPLPPQNPSDNNLAPESENSENDEQADDAGDSKNGNGGDNDTGSGDDTDDPEEKKRQAAKELQKRYEEEAKRVEADKTGRPREKGPYEPAGDEAIQAPGGPQKPAQGQAAEEYRAKKAQDKAAKQERNAARRAARAEAGDGIGGLATRGAGAMARGGEALAGAGRVVGGAIMTGIRAFGMLYINPATAPWAWGLTIGVLCIVLLLVSASGLYGASLGSPNSAGKSMTEPTPVFDQALTDIANNSNITDVESRMINNKEVFLNAFKDVESQISKPGYSEIAVANTRTKIQELRQILEQVSAGNSAQNRKLAETFRTKIKELLAIWGPSINPLKGTALPIIESKISSYGNTAHGKTAISPASNPSHNSYFGSGEAKAGLHPTADAVDIYSKDYNGGTAIFAPFAGHYTKLASNAYDLVGQSSDGQKLEAVMAHIDIAKGFSLESGDVSVGQQFAALQDMNHGAHLHFEMRVDGKDITRRSASEGGQEKLWTMIKTILSGGL